MKAQFKVVLFLLLLSLVFSACQPAAQPVSTGSAITLSDDLGNEISLEQPAQRIISLAPSITEILFAIGAGPQVVGRDDFSNYPEEAVALPSIGGYDGSYNLEQITTLKPDLVLATEINNSEQMKAIEDLGFKVFYLKNPTQLMDGLYQELRMAATLTGHSEETETLIGELENKISKVNKALEAVTDTPLVYYELDATDPAKPFTAGPGTFIDMLFQMAKVENFGARLSSSWVQISQEELIVADPQYIILGDSNYGTTAEQVAQRSGWDVLSAVKENRVFPFNDDLISRPTPRMVDGLIEIVKIVHPEIADSLK